MKLNFLPFLWKYVLVCCTPSSKPQDKMGTARSVATILSTEERAGNEKGEGQNCSGRKVGRGWRRSPVMKHLCPEYWNQHGVDISV